MRTLHSVLSLVNYIDHNPVHVARICDDVTGDFNQVAIAENFLTGLDLIDRSELIGSPATVAKRKYKVIDAQEYPIKDFVDVVTLSEDAIDFFREGLELDLSECEGSIQFLEKVKDSVIDENNNWIGEGDYSIVSVLLEPDKDEE